MPMTRRTFLAGAASLFGVQAARHASPHRASVAAQLRDHTFDPWLEIDGAALAHNVRAVRQLGGNRPVIAVVKNNAYGCGLATVGPLLNRLDDVRAFAVVRPDEALVLQAAGVNKPLLLMGPASDDEAEYLVRRGVFLAAADVTDTERLIALSRRLGDRVPVHLYVDTGMHRMGMPHEAVPAWLSAPALVRALRIEGAFTELTEDQEFDREQAARLRRLASRLQEGGVSLGMLHAASSDAIARPTPEVFLDAIRPGLALYGGYVSAEAMARGELRPVYRLKSRVIRIDRLAAGEGVSYHRRYVAAGPMWTATLGVGHVDGYPSGAVRGCEVLIRGRLYPVIGTVSASHTIVALGAEREAEIGDEAVLVGGDRPALHPNEVARRSGWSEYNMFMHLNPALARRVV